MSKGKYIKKPAGIDYDKKRDKIMKDGRVAIVLRCDECSDQYVYIRDLIDFPLNSVKCWACDNEITKRM